MWTKIQAKLVGAGVILLTILATILRLKSLKGQRDRAKEKSAILTATVNANRIKDQIKREEDQKLSSRRVEIVKEIEEIKEKGKESEGVDNLTNPNDNWS